MDERWASREGPAWRAGHDEAAGDPPRSASPPNLRAGGGEDATKIARDGQISRASGDACQERPRIRIDVPLGTSYLEIQASIFRQAWQLAGTQLRAAVALGLTPDTISRVLKRCERMGLAGPNLPEARTLVRSPELPGPLNQNADPDD